jgi:hypothetical protein
MDTPCRFGAHCHNEGYAHPTTDNVEDVINGLSCLYL